jgi:glutaredoxin 2
MLPALFVSRWAAAGLEGFSTAEARAYLRNKEVMIGSLKDHLAASPDYIATLNRHLPVTCSPEM